VIVVARAIRPHLRHYFHGVSSTLIPPKDPPQLDVLALGLEFTVASDILALLPTRQDIFLNSERRPLNSSSLAFFERETGRANEPP